MWAQILCYKNQGIHWYHCNPTFLWQINFRLVRRLISALIWDISGLWNRSDSRDYREKRIAISRFLALYIIYFVFSTHTKRLYAYYAFVLFILADHKCFCTHKLEHPIFSHYFFIIYSKKYIEWNKIMIYEYQGLTFQICSVVWFHFEKIPYHQFRHG